MQHYVGAGSAVLSTTTAHGLSIHTNRFNSSPAALTISSANAVTCNTSFTNNSDSRLKIDVAPASTTHALEALKTIQAKVYKRIDLDDSPRLGFIAQEVEAAIPSSWGNIVGATEAVEEHVDLDGMTTVPSKPSTLTLDYSRLVCCLWQANRAMLSRIEALEAAS